MDLVVGYLLNLLSALIELYDSAPASLLQVFPTLLGDNYITFLSKIHHIVADEIPIRALVDFFHYVPWALLGIAQAAVRGAVVHLTIVTLLPERKVTFQLEEMEGELTCRRITSRSYQWFLTMETLVFETAENNLPIIRSNQVGC